MPEKGIFQLRKAADLFTKLEHDLARVKKDPADSYAAFDFFVTAFHMYDWKGYPSKKAFSSALKPLDRATWEVCSQLANGSKHFEVFASYGSVKKTKLSRPIFDRNVFDSSAFKVGYLSVRLESATAAHFKKDSLRVDELAERAVEFWRDRL